jgi:hypothetical protein
MKHAILDSLGAVAVMASLTLPFGCVRVPATQADLQPLVAVAGQYAMLSQASPKPAPSGVCSNCGTKVPPGGGFVGDGRVKVPCPECNKDAKASCGCNGKGYVVRPDGSRWACQCSKGGAQCLDGKCDSTPPTAR